MGKYDDIINLPHHRSPYRMPLPMENRAAQFAPFAALSGHEEAINETSRLTCLKVELSNEEKIAISNVISKALANHATVHLTYFTPDKHKSGGSYTQTSGKISGVDEIEKQIRLDTGTCIPMDDIFSITV